MSKFSFVEPYGNDPTIGHLSTPVTTSMLTRAFLGNLPVYRAGLSSLLRGLEVGMAHGYFLIGPFYKLGPLRNSDVALLAGYMSAVGLIIILGLALALYGTATYQDKSTDTTDALETKLGWQKFTGGFFIGALGGVGTAYLLLSQIL
jgi:photosystem I subunit 11